VFAGALMAVAGVYHVLIGIAALVNDKVYVAGTRSVYSFDVTSWGWIHLLLGVLVALAGVAVLRGQLWAGVVGIVLASLSVIANFLNNPWYPIWSLRIIALDIGIVWALATYRREPV
jgi:hypothetical protein